MRCLTAVTCNHFIKNIPRYKSFFMFFVCNHAEPEQPLLISLPSKSANALNLCICIEQTCYILAKSAVVSQYHHCACCAWKFLNVNLITTLYENLPWVNISSFLTGMEEASCEKGVYVSNYVDKTSDFTVIAGPAARIRPTALPDNYFSCKFLSAGPATSLSICSICKLRCWHCPVPLSSVDYQGLVKSLSVCKAFQMWHLCSQEEWKIICLLGFTSNNPALLPLSLLCVDPEVQEARSANEAVPQRTPSQTDALRPQQSHRERAHLHEGGMAGCTVSWWLLRWECANKPKRRWRFLHKKQQHIIWTRSMLIGCTHGGLEIERQELVISCLNHKRFGKGLVLLLNTVNRTW